MLLSAKTNGHLADSHVETRAGVSWCNEYCEVSYVF